MELRLALAFGLALSNGFVSLSYADCPPPSCDRTPTEIVIGFSPGSIADILARAIAQTLQEQWSVDNVIVENRVGAGGTVAADRVAKSAPNGVRVLLASSALQMAPNLYQRLPFDPQRDLVPAALVASVPLVLAVNPAVEVRSFNEFVARARANPGRLSYGSSGAGSLDHIANEILNQSTGIRTNHVPYRGAGPAVNDLMGGQVQYLMAAPAAVQSLARAGKVRILATTGDKRTDTLPDVPTLGELGVRDAVVENRFVLYVPNGTPNPVIGRWNASISRAVREPRVRQVFEQQSASSQSASPEEVRRLVTAESQQLARAIRAAGIKAE